MTSSLAPPHSTACSPNRSVSVSSRKLVSIAPAQRAADARRISERLGPRAAARILLDREQAGHAAADLIFAADEVARALGRDQHDVEVAARHDLAIMDREAVGDEQGVARREVRLDVVRHRPCGGSCRG